MKLILFFYISFILTATAEEAPTAIKISNSPLNDSVKISQLLNTAWELRSNNPLEAIRLATEARDLASEKDDLVELAKASNYLGVIHTNIGANDIALDYHELALKIARDADDWEQIAYSYNNIGGIYRIKNNIELASKNILDAIKIFEEHNNSIGLTYCYLNLGRLYKDQENYKQSMNHLSYALDQSKYLPDKGIRAKVLLEIAELLKLQSFFVSAKIAFDELVIIYGDLNDKKGLAEVWNSLSEISLIAKEYKQAMEYAEKAIEVNKEILNYEGEIKNLIILSQIHNAKGNRILAEEALHAALNRSEQLNITTLEAQVYHSYYKYYKTVNNPSKALQYYELYNSLNDSIVTKEEIVRLGELESLLKIERATSENQKLQTELQLHTTQRNYVFVIALLAMVFVGFISYRFYEKKKLSVKLEEINTVKDKFFRIIAHDLREPFNAIFAAVELLKDSFNELSPEEAKEIIDTIGKSVKSDFDLLENLLFWARSQSNTIQFEPENLNLRKTMNQNLDVAQTNIRNKNINVQLQCDQEIEIYADEQMLNTIIRNLLMNAVKFTPLSGTVKLSCSENSKETMIEFIDSGIGMDSDTLENLFKLDKKIVSKGTAGEVGSGLGLIVVKEFVDKHRGKIYAESKPDKGSKFTVVFPK